MYKQKFNEVHDKVVEEMGVSPEHWQVIVERLTQDYGKNIISGLGHFDDIYKILPDIFDGVIETLETCKESGIKLGVVTHAKKEWTDFKIDRLRSYFEHIITVDPDVYKWKGPEHWKESIKLIKLVI